MTLPPWLRRGPLAHGVKDRARERLLRAAWPWQRLRRAWSKAAPAGGWIAGLDPPAGSGPVMVLTGWALHPQHGAATRVDVSVDGQHAARARLGLPRVGMALRHTHPDSAVCGFEVALDLRGAAPEQARIDLTGVVDAWADPFHLTLSWPRTRDAAPPPVSPPPPRAATTRERLRLLVFTHDLTPGGSQLYLQDLLLGLVTRGFEASVIAPADGPLRAALEAEGIRLHLSGRHPHEDLSRHRARVAALAQLAAASRPDVIVANSLGSFVGAEVAASLGVPCVWAIHESLDLPVYLTLAFGTGLHPAVAARFAPLLADATTVFEARATRSLFLPHVPADRAVCLPLAVDADAALRRRAQHLREARRQLSLPPDATVLLSMATIEPRKGQVTLARAFQRIAERHPRAHLLLVGDRGGGYATALRGLAARGGLAGRVSVLPVTGDPSACYAAADVLVGAGDIESMPRCILDAMAFGLPVVATDVFGTAEAVEDGVTGFLCAANDVTSLSQALDRMLRLPAEARAAMGSAGERRVREQHDLGAYVRSFAALLQATAADPRAPVAADASVGVIRQSPSTSSR